MASQTPGGAVRQFAGVDITSSFGVASIGFPTIDKAPVEAYEQVLGRPQVVDLLGTADAPQRQTLTCQVLIRADDKSGTPWQDVMAGYRALEAMPQTGTLLVDRDATGNGTLSCQARRRPIPLKLSPSNARHIVVELSFTILSDFQ